MLWPLPDSTAFKQAILCPTPHHVYKQTLVGECTSNHCLPHHLSSVLPSILLPPFCGRKVHVVPAKTIAFVHYEWRCSAEFAKEAMHAQCLKGVTTGEVLTVCWANDDPNPSAIRQVKQDRVDVFAAASARRLGELPEDQKRARLSQMELAATGAYPNTDPSYPGLPPSYRGAPVVPGQGFPQQWAPGGWPAVPAGPQPSSVPRPPPGIGGPSTDAAADDLEDDISRYCADDPYYDQELEEAALPPETSAAAGAAAHPMPGQPGSGAGGAAASAATPLAAAGDGGGGEVGGFTEGGGGAEAEPRAAHTALGLLAGYGSGEDTSNSDN
mmetsp:Transcript_12101/g.34010  ORF Transcript_12101/g.34010 Transcript_12101/m.34010 type:complete len:327 (-) Transcript_12101:331-1311(-)